MSDGYCQCGCGGKTPIATRTRKYLGTIKGEPLRFLRGHQNYLKPEYIVEDRGFQTPCWTWNKSTVPNTGYGQKHVNRHPQAAHRWYWENANGPVPEGLVLDHLCRNRACVNPDHLEAVTCAENIRRGEKATLTHDQVREIRRIGKASDELAARFGVTRWTLYDILNGRSWKGLI